MANTKSVSLQMEAIIEEYTDKVNEVLKRATEQVSTDTVERLQSKSPRKSGEYAAGWTKKTTAKNEVVVYNTHYQLTHLLENGHVIRNKKGTYGRTSGKKHIKPAENWANREFQRKIEEGLR